MNRKNFIRSSASLLTVSALPVSSLESFNDSESNIIRSPYLKPGDLIGITSPAGYITLEEIQPAVKLMENWGYKIKIGDTIGKKDFTFGGTDEERLNDLQQMLDDPKIKAVMCARGGYGVLRIIDKLKWDKFKIKP